MFVRDWSEISAQNHLINNSCVFSLEEEKQSVFFFSFFSPAAPPSACCGSSYRCVSLTLYYECTRSGWWDYLLICVCMCRLRWWAKKHTFLSPFPKHFLVIRLTTSCPPVVIFLLQNFLSSFIYELIYELKCNIKKKKQKLSHMMEKRKQKPAWFSEAEFTKHPHVCYLVKNEIIIFIVIMKCLNMNCLLY